MEYKSGDKVRIIKQGMFFFQEGVVLSNTKTPFKPLKVELLNAGDWFFNLVDVELLKSDGKITEPKKSEIKPVDALKSESDTTTPIKTKKPTVKPKKAVKENNKEVKVKRPYNKKIKTDGTKI